jgi:hypothetical protein
MNTFAFWSFSLYFLFLFIDLSFQYSGDFTYFNDVGRGACGDQIDARREVWLLHFQITLSHRHCTASRRSQQPLVFIWQFHLLSQFESMRTGKLQWSFDSRTGNG